jgi:hypothetical protein
LEGFRGDQGEWRASLDLGLDPTMLLFHGAHQFLTPDQHLPDPAPKGAGRRGIRRLQGFEVGMLQDLLEKMQAFVEQVRKKIRQVVLLAL